MAWKKLSTKKIFDHSRLQIYEDMVELPGGHQTDYVYFKNKDAAIIIAVNEQGKVLLQKEYSYPMNEWLFQFPGGALEKDETPLDGAARELAEEGQLKGVLKEIGWFYPDNRRSKSKMHVFVATNLRPAPTENDVEEEFEDYWFTPHEINELTRKNEIRNYSALAAWAFFVNTT
jgi:8-oxo-dGTP pyrophosphatase MutT (NUDIX family)